MSENPMRRIFVEKVVLNIGCGGDVQKIERAFKLLQKLTNRKPVITYSRKRSTFGIPKGRPIGVKVTLRKKEAVEFLKKAFKAIDKLSTKSFDDWGNFSFGIKEYIDFPNVKYDPKLGIKGMDICVSLERPGYRIKRRKIGRRRIGKKHKITKEEAINFVEGIFAVKVI